MQRRTIWIAVAAITVQGFTVLGSVADHEEGTR